MPIILTRIIRDEREVAWVNDTDLKVIELTLAGASALCLRQARLTCNFSATNFSVGRLVSCRGIAALSVPPIAAPVYFFASSPACF